MSRRAENLYIGLTFCALSNGKFSFQSQNFRQPSYMILGGDLVDTLNFLQFLHYTIVDLVTNIYIAAC